MGKGDRFEVERIWVLVMVLDRHVMDGRLLRIQKVLISKVVLTGHILEP